MPKTLQLSKAEIKQAQGGIPDPIAEGTYGAVIFESVWKQSRAGNDMYELNFKITEGPEGVGRKLKGWFALTPKALFKVNELIKATGVGEVVTKTTKPGKINFPDEDDFLGIDVVLEVTQTPYESIELLDEDPETGEKFLDADGEPEEREVEVTKFRNNIAKVLNYDKFSHTIGLTEDADDAEGVFL